MKWLWFIAAQLFSFGAFAQTHNSRKELMSDPDITRILENKSSYGAWQKNMDLIKPTPDGSDPYKPLFQTLFSEKFWSKNAIFADAECTKKLRYADWKARFPAQPPTDSIFLHAYQLLCFSQRTHVVFSFVEVVAVQRIRPKQNPEVLFYFRPENGHKPVQTNSVAWQYRSIICQNTDNSIVKTAPDGWPQTLLGAYLAQLESRADSQFIFKDTRFLQHYTADEIRQFAQGSLAVAGEDFQRYTISQAEQREGIALLTLAQDWYFDAKTQRIGVVSRYFSPTYQLSLATHDHAGHYPRVTPLYKPVYKSLIPNKK